MARFALIGVLLAATAGCGVSDEDRKEAGQKCTALVDALCSRLADCQPGADRSKTYTDCKGSAATAIDCWKATGVTEAYPRCLSEVQAMTCAVTTAGGMLNSPASCTKVILHD